MGIVEEEEEALANQLRQGKGKGVEGKSGLSISSGSGLSGKSSNYVKKYL